MASEGQTDPLDKPELGGMVGYMLAGSSVSVMYAPFQLLR